MRVLVAPGVPALCSAILPRPPEQALAGAESQVDRGPTAELPR